MEKLFEELENEVKFVVAWIRREEMGRQKIEIDYTHLPLLSAIYKIGSEELNQAFHATTRTESLREK